jgi:hypothetical protein
VTTATYNVVIDYKTTGNAGPPGGVGGPLGGGGGRGTTGGTTSQLAQQRAAMRQAREDQLAGLRGMNRDQVQEYRARVFNQSWHNREMQANLKRAKAHEHHIDQAAGLIGGAALGLGLGVIGAVKSAFEEVFSLIKEGLTEINAELETNKISFASTFMVNKLAPNMEVGMQQANSLMRTMRKDIRKHPGTMSELIDVFQGAQTTGLHMGMSPEKLEDMSAMAMTFGKLKLKRGTSMATVGNQLSMMLAGHARNTNPLASHLLGAENVASFNEMSGGDRIAEITKRFEEQRPILEMAEHSWEGLMTTIKTEAQMSLAEATAPLFEAIKSKMGLIIAWWDAHSDEVRAKIDKVGMFLSDTFDRLWNGASRLRDALVPVADVMTTADKTGATAVSTGPMFMLGPMLGGIMESLTDAGSVFYGFSNMLKDTLGDSFTNIFTSLKNVFAALQPFLRAMADTLGTYWLGLLTGAVFVLEMFCSGLELLVTTLKSVFDAIYERLPDSTKKVLGIAYNSLYEKVVGREAKSMTFGEDLPGTGTGVRDPPSPPNHGTNIQKVEIVIRSNEDPSRIARLTRDALINLKTNPGTAASSTGFGERK